MVTVTVIFWSLNLYSASLPSLDDLVKDKAGQDNQLIERYISETSKEMRMKKNKEVLDSILDETKENGEEKASAEFMEDNSIIKSGDLNYCQITTANHDLVDFFIKYYTTVGKTYLERSLERMRVIYPFIQETFKKHNLPEELLLLGIVESGFTADALSQKGARGIWQLMPLTAKIYGLKVNNYIDERMDIVKSTEAAALYLKSLSDTFNAQWDLVIASYNGGGGYISSQIRKYKQTSFWDLCQISGFKNETLEYVPRFHAILSIIKNPGIYNIKLPVFPSKINFESIESPGELHIKTLSHYTSIPEYQLRELNPHLLQNMALKGVNLYVPINMGQMALTQINRSSAKGSRSIASAPRKASTPAQTGPVKYRVIRYKVKNGESLSFIARKHNVSYRTLARYNNLSNPKHLRQGTIIKIPNKYYASTENYTTTARIKQTNAEVKQKISAAKPILQHRVHQGETLYRIARRYNVTAQDIMDYNQISNPKRIYRGMLLKIPVKKSAKKNVVAYRLQKGETLYTIARRFNTSVAILTSLNKIEDASNLPTGKVIYVPNS